MKPILLNDLDYDAKHVAVRAMHQTRMTWPQLTEKRKARQVSHKRWEAFKVFREAGYSLPEIGRFFGMDHTTVLHGLRQLEARS